MTRVKKVGHMVKTMVGFSGENWWNWAGSNRVNSVVKNQCNSVKNWSKVDDKLVNWINKSVKSADNPFQREITILPR
jgi:hypothetical protein